MRRNEPELLSISRDEADETIRAIRSGRVDAVVVNSATGQEVLTFASPTTPIALVEAMGEGAALVTRDGVICYHNPRFAILVGGDESSLLGHALRRVAPVDAAVAIDALLERARRGPARLEVAIAVPGWTPSGRCS